MHNNLFFIVGVGRSGTTLIRLMLNSHPDVAIPYETHFITNYIGQLDKYGSLSVADNLDRLIGDLLKEDLLSKWDKVPTLEEVKAQLGSNPTLSDVIDAIYICYARAHGKKYWETSRIIWTECMKSMHCFRTPSSFISCETDGMLLNRY